MKNDIISYLNNRNLIFNISNKKKLTYILHKNLINLYCGFDPTSDSLHIGHLILIICIKEFIENNHNIIILLGIYTGIIGDPSFRNTKRNILDKDTILNNSKKISLQIKNLIDINNNIKIINNNWLKSLNLIDFLYKIGNKFSVIQMFNKVSLKNRINCKKDKVTFSEFSYSILQSYDFLYLYKKHNVILQIGGSDQWGNITSGINLIRKIYKAESYCITTPILTNSDGNKFCKTNNNNIWLDKSKTSVYKFYQFWLNISDDYVLNLLKILTKEPLEYINYISNERTYKNIKEAKMLLAKYITILVHGEYEFNLVNKISKNLFNNIKNLSENDIYELYNNIPYLKLKLEINIITVLNLFKIVKSNKQAKELIFSGSIRINDKNINNFKYNISKEDLLYNKYIILRKGKKDYYLIISI